MGLVGLVSNAKIEQRRLSHRGRHFHFVSYEGQPANAAKLEVATGRAWFLMSGGKRWSVMPEEPGLAEVELNRLLTGWLDGHVFV